MLVQTKQSDDVSIIVPRTRLSRGAALLRPFLDSLPLFLYSAPNKFNFSPAVVPDSLARIATSVAPDIVHLHWVCEGFIRLESIKRLSRPILWTLHDSWAFTGGCHTPFDCLRYQDSCGTCPALGSLRGNDFSRRVWQRKKNAWKGVNLTVVAPSHWLASCVMSSSLFREVRVEVIPNGLDMQCYRPIDKHFARDLLSLPQNKKLILYNGIGSIVDPNKGRHQIIKAIR